MADAGFAPLPDSILVRTDLTAAHKLVLAVLIRLQGEKSCCYPSIEYIAKTIGMSRAQITRILGDLAKRNEIIRVRHPYRSNTYSVQWQNARNRRRVWLSKNGTQS